MNLHDLFERITFGNVEHTGFKVPCRLCFDSKSGGKFEHQFGKSINFDIKTQTICETKELRSRLKTQDIIFYVFSLLNAFE